MRSLPLARRATQPSLMSAVAVRTILCGFDQSLTKFLVDVVGTDVRKLAFDGYTAKNIFGTELSRAFIKAGHKLYSDADTCEIRFIPADIFELPVQITEDTQIPEKVAELVKLRHSFTHIYSGAFFHMFDEDAQYQVALRFVTLVKPEKGVIIYGNHHGAQEGEKIEHASK